MKRCLFVVASPKVKEMGNHCVVVAMNQVNKKGK
jgi:hypothetical protein